MSAKSPHPETRPSEAGQVPRTPDGHNAGEREENISANLKAVKTFAFDVSAGRQACAEDAELPLPSVPRPKFLGYPITIDPSHQTQLESPCDSEEASKAQTSEVQSQFEDESAEPIWVPKITIHPKRPARRLSAWWSVSLVVHLAILWALTYSTMVVFSEEEQVDFAASPVAYEALEEFVDIEVELDDALESMEESLDSSLSELEEAESTESIVESLEDLSPLAELETSETGEVIPTGGGELGELFSSAGTALTELPTNETGAVASFFGAKIEARRILFMLDNSGGMRRGGKFEALVKELLASVAALDRKQHFYVVFYSDTVYPLFYPQSMRRFLPATEKNVKQLELWLDTVELCTGNAIDEALAAAEVIQPEAVFLLTDGNLFTTDEKKALLLNSNRRRYSIHTFGFGVNDQTKTAAGLQQIAEANGGTYHAVKISDEMKALEKAKERPYHSKQPGAVWGIKVGQR